MSGQNVALALAITAPLVKRTRPGLRLAATLALIGWFVMLTRAEPSVLRAGTMAALAALLSQSVASENHHGYSLPRLSFCSSSIRCSCARSASGSPSADLPGSRSSGHRCARDSPPSVRWLPVGDDRRGAARRTAPSVLVFGRFSVSGIVANLGAVPVAGLVMLYGLPASLVAGAVPAARSVLMAPVALGTRWVDTVAAGAAVLERHPPWNFVVTIAFLAGSLFAIRSAGGTRRVEERNNEAREHPRPHRR